MMPTPLFGPEGPGGSEPFRRAMIAELREAGLRREDFEQNRIPGMIWKEEARDVFVKPTDVGDVRLEPDEINAGRVKATLQFSLPRGAYATMLIKRLFAPSWFARRPGEEEWLSPDSPRGRYDARRQQAVRDNVDHDED